MRAEHDMTAAPASAPPRLRRVLLCLLLALAMLVSFCLPSFDAIGLGVQSAWGATVEEDGGEEGGEDSGDTGDPDADDEDPSSATGLKVDVSSTDLVKTRTKTLKIGTNSCTIKTLKNGNTTHYPNKGLPKELGSKPTNPNNKACNVWYETGYTYLYLVNDAPDNVKTAFGDTMYGITDKTQSKNAVLRANDYETKLKCSGWAKYKISFHIKGTSGSFDDSSVGKIAKTTQSFISPDKNKKYTIPAGTYLTGYADFGAGKHSIGDQWEACNRTVEIKLKEVSSSGTIGKLQLAEKEADMLCDVGADMGKNTNKLIIPTKLVYTMPTGDQSFRYTLKNNGNLSDADAKSYADGICDYVGGHRLTMNINDLGGSSVNAKGNTELRLRQKNADGNGPDGNKVNLRISINAASCGLRAANLYKMIDGVKTVQGGFLNLGSWQLSATANTKEKLILDLDGGVATNAKTTLAKSQQVYTNGYSSITDKTKKLEGEGHKFANGSVVHVPNPVKPGYTFAGWKWVGSEFDGKDKYDDALGNKKYHAFSGIKENLTTQAEADKFALDTSEIKGKVYGSASSATESTIAIQNGFNGQEVGYGNKWSSVQRYVGCATAKYKAMWTTSDSNSITYKVGTMQDDGSVSDWQVVKSYNNVQAGSDLTGKRHSASSFGATGWFDWEDCATSIKVPTKMPNYSLVFYGYKEPQGEVEKGTARINYYVDGVRCTSYTIKFDQQYGTADGTGYKNGDVNKNLDAYKGSSGYSAEDMRNYKNDASWNANTQKLTAHYVQYSDSGAACAHPETCVHPNYYGPYCSGWDDEGHCTGYYYTDKIDTKYKHGSCSNPKPGDSYWTVSDSNATVPQSAVECSHGAPNDMGHTDSVCGTNKWYKWYLNDRNCEGSPTTSFDVKKNKTYNLYSYTLHKVTYTVNPAKDPNGGADVYTGKIKSGKTYEKNYTHWEKWSATEHPEDMTEDNGECNTMHTGTGDSNPTGKCFDPSELPEPRLTFYGWYKDPKCETNAEPVKVGSVTPADPKSHLHFYSYTTHEIRYVLNPGGANEEILSEEVRLGQSCEEFSKEAMETVEAALDPDRDKAYGYGWSDTGNAIDFNRGSENADGKEGAEPNVVYSIVTYHEGHLITDIDKDREKDWKYSELFPGAESFPLKQGVSYPTPTYGNTGSHHTSDKVTLPNCEIWDSHATEDGLVPDQWFNQVYSDPTNTITGNSDATIYSYNVNYLTLDFTTYAKSLDKDLEGKYQLFSEKVEKKTEHSATKLKVNGIPGLRGYLEYTDYEKCGNCSHTEHSTLYKGGSEQIANHHLYIYGEEAEIPVLRPCYWLNDSKLNNTGYNEGDQLLSRNARNPEGGAYLTPDAKRNQMTGLNYVVKGNTVLYMDYVQGLYDGVITG